MIERLEHDETSAEGNLSLSRLGRGKRRSPKGVAQFIFLGALGVPGAGLEVGSPIK
jgi:hypothetical protein